MIGPPFDLVNSQKILLSRRLIDLNLYFSLLWQLVWSIEYILVVSTICAFLNVFLKIASQRKCIEIKSIDFDCSRLEEMKLTSLAACSWLGMYRRPRWKDEDAKNLLLPVYGFNYSRTVSTSLFSMESIIVFHNVLWLFWPVRLVVLADSNFEFDRLFWIKIFFHLVAKPLIHDTHAC